MLRAASAHCRNQQAEYRRQSWEPPENEEETSPRAPWNLGSAAQAGQFSGLTGNHTENDERKQKSLGTWQAGQKMLHRFRTKGINGTKGTSLAMRGSGRTKEHNALNATQFPVVAP